ncbi:MAG TPA: hypothetical protein VGL40_07520 [Bacillota bacterium]|jgi:hypothetical protein
MTPTDLALTQDETEALVCLRELLALARAAAPVWPGWDPSTIPFLLYKPSGSAFLVNHPFPPAEFYVINAGDSLGRVYGYHGELRKLRRTGSSEINGFETVVVPIAFGSGLDRSEAFLAELAGEAFHRHQEGLGIVPPLTAMADAYPDLSAENNALGNLEGRVLFEAMASARQPEVVREALAPVAREFLAVRQARRAGLPWEMAQYEETVELCAGPATYVEDRLLDFGSQAPYRSSREWRELLGRERLDYGGALLEKRLERLKSINARGEGATYDRFVLTGSAIAHLLDVLEPRWPARVLGAGASLTATLAEVAAFQPAAGPGLLAKAQENHAYAAQYDDERAFADEEEARRQSLLDSVLGQRGRRFVFDLSRVRMTGSDVDAAGVERIDQTRRLHRRRGTFFYRETMLDFAGLPVVEDRGGGTFTVVVPPRDLAFTVDHEPFSASEHGRFHQRLELTGPGVKVVASAGTIEYDDGIVYVHIER